MSVRIFLHGLDSSNQGTKALFFKERYPDMIIPNFSGSLEDRMKNLHDILAEKSEITLVGSSFGGLMAWIFSMENEEIVDRLILLAPALNLLDFSNYQKKEISVPVWIYHGINDTVIPLKAVESIAKTSFQQLSFNVADDDHSLHNIFKTLDWDSLLREQ